MGVHRWGGLNASTDQRILPWWHPYKNDHSDEKIIEWLACCDDIPELITEQDGSNDCDDYCNKPLENLTTSVDFKLHSTPNIWIYETGTTIHNTPHAIGITDDEKGIVKDTTTTGNGAMIKTASIGTTKGLVTTKTGESLLSVTLKEVNHTPESKFNFILVIKWWRMSVQ